MEERGAQKEPARGKARQLLKSEVWFNVYESIEQLNN